MLKPHQFHFGVSNTDAYQPGPLGIISFSDRLTDYVAQSLSDRGMGQSLMVSLGNDSFIGASLHDWLPVLAANADTHYILVLGLLYGDRHEAMLKFKQSRKKGSGKPVIFYALGLSTPLAHLPTNAQDIVIDQLGHRPDGNLAIADKINQLQEAGVTVVQNIEQLIHTMKNLTEAS
ncbi:MAG: hypothetical protein HC796_02165 [Synechococcaceae cyanobacterium RL_1_2]|nr:hypothetical protein [Synechococcaceae cyanobacterium RL_1_2]